MTPTVRIGIEGNRTPVMSYIRENGLPVLVSANSLWDNRRRIFRGWHAYRDLDVALDSGGYVAMKRFGGYRFEVEQYAELAATMKPSWWAQMDFCCEPEIAGDSRTVARRIDLTARYLEACRAASRESGASQPLIVLQGWQPDDYCRGPIYDQSFRWPPLVCVGSVCRRALHGRCGLLAVVDALDRVLPPHVRLHLFGVKGIALRHLRHHPRFASMDSQAWSLQARWTAAKAGIPCNGALRTQSLAHWMSRQSVYLS